MKINYKINNFVHKIYIKKQISSYILNDIERLNSDRKILLICDGNVNKKFINNIVSNLKIKGLQISIAEVNGGKVKKNEKLLFKLIDILIEKKFTKKSILMSIGGGVVGDVSGLAASLYLRGIIYLHIPTTMTAIIDSCLGGKTAINYKKIINSIGNYYHSHSVYISLDIIRNLPEREYLSGFPEILKCALISKKRFFLNFLLKNNKKIIMRKESVVKKICYETLKIKISFFLKDINEQNKRLMLNFGHTFAHAIEMATDIYKKEYFRHGEAVGLGVLCEIYYSNKNRNSLFKLVENFLYKLNLPTRINNKNINKIKLQSDIYKYLYLDKKKIGKHPRYISLKSIGKPKIGNLENDTLINETILNII